MAARATAPVYRWLAVTSIALFGLVHAARYDFFCDDALIALRYAQHLISNHEPSYNLGERVEGFTSPLWVLLVSVGGFFGAPLTSVARAVGALASLGTFWSLAACFDQLSPKRWLVVVPAACLALSVPFAAWTFGGLETPLFVCLYTLTLALIANAGSRSSVRSAWHAGITAAAATLARPEGATLLVVGTAALYLPGFRQSGTRLRERLVAWGLPIVTLVGGYEVFRVCYYGYPLPNTFYVKTSGSNLWGRGLSYVAFAGHELGWLLVVSVTLSAVLLLVPSRLSRGLRPGARLLVACAAVAALVQVTYVASVGGDFLDCYRFFTPLLPVAFCLLACAAGALFDAVEGSGRWFVAVVTAGLLAAYAQSERAMAHEATLVAAPSRAALGLEPLGWTRLYGKRWQGIGRWLAQVATRTDTTAVGAAGAIPFYSGLPNLDLFGLNDLEIAHHGLVIGNRPGHQRFATMDYVFARRPTFIFMRPESTPLESRSLERDPYWTSHGYVAIEIKVDRALCDCPESFYHQFLVTRERAESLRGRSDVSVGR